MVTTVKKTGRKPLPPGPGRPKGVPNKVTTELKQMILDALERAGGVEYLAEKAESNPGAFMTLIGKVLPLQVTGDPNNPLGVVVTVKDYTGRKRDGEG